MSYSRSTLTAFSAALARAHQDGDPTSPAPADLPAGQSSAEDMAFLLNLLELHRKQATQPRPPAPPPPSGEELAARFSRLRDRGLTARECEVVGWIAQGKRDAEIATILGCAPKTVGKHVEHLLAKLGAETRLAAANTAADLLKADSPHSTLPHV